MAGKGPSAQFLNQIDVLVRRVNEVQRSLIEENQTCTAFRDLIDISEKENKEIENEVQRLQKSNAEYQKRAENFSLVQNLRSSLVVYENSSILQDEENNQLKAEHEEIDQVHVEMCREHYGKLEAIKEEFAGLLVDESIVENKIKAEQLMRQKESLVKDLEFHKEKHRAANVEDWQLFKLQVLKLAPLQKERAEQRVKLDGVLQYKENIEKEKDAAKKKICTAISRKKQEQEEKEKQLQQQQLNQIQLKQLQNLPPEQPLASFLRDSRQRQDTPRPKSLTSFRLSLPKLKLPAYGKNKFSNSLNIPKDAEDEAPTGSGRSTKSLEGKIISSPIDKEPLSPSLNLKTKISSWAVIGSPVLAPRSTPSPTLSDGDISTSIDEARKEAGNNSAISQSNASTSTPVKIRSSITDVNRCTSVDTQGVESTNESIRVPGGLSNTSPYFKNVTKSQNVITCQDSTEALRSSSKSRPSNQRALFPQSVDARTSIFPPPGMQSTPPSSPAQQLNKKDSPLMTLSSQEAREAYISSLMKSPEMVYGKPPPPVKYSARVPRLCKSLPAVSPENDMPGQYADSSNTENLPESRQNLETHSNVANEPVPMELDSSDPELQDMILGSSQGFVLEEEAECFTGQQNDDQQNLAPSETGNVSESSSVTSSLIVEPPTSIGMMSSVLDDSAINLTRQQGSLQNEDSSLFAVPSSSFHQGSSQNENTSFCTVPSSSYSDFSNLDQQNVLSKPKMCSSPNMSMRGMKKPSTDKPMKEHTTMSSNVPSPIFGNTSSQDIGETSSFVPFFDNSHFLFGTDTSNSNSDSGAFSLFATPTGSGNSSSGASALSLFASAADSQVSEPAKESSGVNFSLFGTNPTTIQEDSSNFFTFSFDGGSSMGDSSASGGILSSLFGNSSSEDEGNTSDRPNFKLF